MQLAADGIIIINYNILLTLSIILILITAKKPSSLPKNWPNSTPEVYKIINMVLSLIIILFLGYSCKTSKNY